VQLLVGVGISHEQICKCIRNPHTRRPIGVKTLERCFPQEIDRGRAATDALVATMLMEKIKEGNVTAIIWFTKNRWGWADHVETHRTGVDLKIEISPEDLARQLEERGLATTIFGTDKPTMIEGSGTLVPEPVEPRLLEGNGAGDVATRSRH